MATRLIRDGLLDSEIVSQLHDKTFRLFIHLVLSADDYGLIATDYGPIKRTAPLLDWSREMIAKMLSELIDVGLIIPYQDSGKSYAAIAKSKSRINCTKPKWPIPTFGMGHCLEPYEYKNEYVKKEALKILNHINDETSKSVPPVSHQCPTSGELVGLKDKGEGIRGKGKRIKDKGEALKPVLNTITNDLPLVSDSSEKNPEESKRKKGKRLSEDWILLKAWGDWAMQSERLTRGEVERQAEMFRDYWLSNGTTKVDWFATWRNWIRNRDRFNIGKKSIDTESERQEKIAAFVSMIKKDKQNG